MARKYNEISSNILRFLADHKSGKVFDEIKSTCAPRLSGKDFYNFLFRLKQQELVLKNDDKFTITKEGLGLLGRLQPEKDGVWKMVVFDIPEKQKKVRIILRGKLKQLHFKKWQNSIWISPYKLEPEIEEELIALGEKFFVRLIKVSWVSQQKELEKMFP